MDVTIAGGLLLPFLGTSAGAACVFFMRQELRLRTEILLTGFAAGVMTAASVWSLLIPAMEQSSGLGRLSFLPAVAGFWGGILFMLLLDSLIPHQHLNSDQPEGVRSRLAKTTMMVLAVTLHNIPEGMAVGLSWPLALGIGIQNFPEGAAISLPLRKTGASRLKSFLLGSATGIVEPLFGILAVLIAKQAQASMPWLLSFAAGAMIYVVVEELIPEAHMGERSTAGTLGVIIGFLLMMILDVSLG